MTRTYKKDEERIVVKNIRPEVKNELVAIAKNEGLTLSAFLKPHLRKIRDSYPLNMRAIQED